MKSRRTSDSVQGRSSESGSTEDEADALARAWPRELKAAGQGFLLARWWRSEQRSAVERGEPPLPRAEATATLLALLADARRARRLHRGLEGASARLESEEAGLRAAGATRPRSEEGIRISRLLILGADGSARFYREAVALRARHATRLEVLMLDCDEARLGEAIYGRGRRARAVLLDHKEAVARFLSVLERGLQGGPAPRSG